MKISIFRPLRRLQRQYDIMQLWPIIKKDAPTLDNARLVFQFHAFNDSCWTTDLSEEEIMKIVMELE